MLSSAEIQKGRILVVDDTESHILLLRKVLKGGGYLSVATTTNPAEAVDLYKEFQPDLVILDLHMAPIDGFQVLEQLKAVEPADSYVPALMMTALNDPDVLVRALERGARDFLNKPFERVEALTRIRNMLEVRILHNRVRDQNRILEETVRARTQEIRETRLEVIRRLGRAAEYRDNETGLHIIRMSLAAAILGRAVGLSRDQCDLILNASPMHDIGKIGIPDRILLKPGPLEPDEWKVMRRHPIIGAELLAGGSSDLMQMAESIAYCHHEKYDGTGYPRGLEGESIPLAARIVAVCDVFDALLSRRPYKAPWTVDQALAELDKRAGSHFDPALVETFHGVIDQVLEVHARYADDHESATEVIKASVTLRAAQPR
ncbi:MAG TPA: HD domain-containing phosphohydrolase [Polyangiaceae bacterium]|jgi:putative two-component system response regulator